MRTIAEQIKKLNDVASLDEDRITLVFGFTHGDESYQFYQTDADGNRKDRLSFKFLADQIPNLPKPKPMFEIFVYHLGSRRYICEAASGRGGLRWSDRMEDFRTEVLGLVRLKW